MTIDELKDVVTTVFVERRKKLVAALRSRRYKQTRMRLGRCTDEELTYCCLGVACEVAIEEGLDVVRLESDNLLLYDDQKTCLPESVKDFFGFSNDAGAFEGRHGTSSLMKLNDNGTPFEQIADTIEMNPKGLFV